MAYDLTKKEIYVLMNILQARILIGITDPFTGLLSHEIEAEWKQVFRRLREKKLVDLVNEELVFDDPFIQLMWILARTNVVVQVDSPDRAEPASLFYFGDDTVVECEETSPGNYRMYQRGNPTETWENDIIPLLHLQDVPARREETLFMTPSDFTVISNKGMQAKRESIFKANQGRGAADALEACLDDFDEALRNRKHIRRLMMFYFQEDKWNIEGLHTLISETTNWSLKMIRHQNSEWLEARQADGAGLFKEILDVIYRVKNEGRGIVWND